MSKSKLHYVHLPNLKPTVELPRVLAATLELIIDASPCGIPTPRLQEAGIISVHSNVTELRKRGAIIHTEKGVFIDRSGRRITRIAHYSYKGWIEEKIGEQDIENGGSCE